MDAVGLEQAAVAGADFPGDVTAPPIGGQAITAVLFGRRIHGDVIRAFQLDDVRCMAGDARVTAAGGVGQEFDAEFDAGVLQGIKIPDLGLDGGEVGHVFCYLL